MSENTNFSHVRMVLIAGVVAMLLVGLLQYGATLYNMSFEANDMSHWAVVYAVNFLFLYTGWYVYFITTYFVLRRIARTKSVRRALGFLVVAILFWVPVLTIYDASLHAWLVRLSPRSLLDDILNTPVFFTFVKTLTCLIFFGLASFLVYWELYKKSQDTLKQAKQEMAQAKLDNVEQRLANLQQQLAPHFLFNCLNMLSSLARMGKTDDIVFTTARLGDMLRFVFAATDKTIIPLRDEVDLIENYAELQKARFGNKYALTINCEGDISNVSCPPYCLQTFVENAYSHSSTSKQSKIFIEVNIEVAIDALNISVKNNNSKEKTEANLGVAMSNLRQRLAIMYEDNFILMADQQADNYTVNMRLPL